MAITKLGATLIEHMHDLDSSLMQQNHRIMPADEFYRHIDSKADEIFRDLGYTIVGSDGISAKDYKQALSSLDRVKVPEVRRQAILRRLSEFKKDPGKMIPRYDDLGVSVHPDARLVRLRGINWDAIGGRYKRSEMEKLLKFHEAIEALTSENEYSKFYGKLSGNNSTGGLSNPAKGPGNLSAMFKVKNLTTGKEGMLLGHYDIRVPLLERLLTDSVVEDNATLNRLRELRRDSRETAFLNELGGFNPDIPNGRFSKKNVVNVLNAMIKNKFTSLKPYKFMDFHVFR